MPGKTLRLDKDMLQKARNGDPDAFELLTRRYSGRILATSRRFLRNPADAEDNVQNVLFKAFTNLRQFEGNSLLSTWLTRIAINEALMKLRASTTEKQHLKFADEAKAQAPSEVPSSRSNPEAQCIARELALSAMKCVSPALREVFVLHAVEGWTQKELSANHGVALQTVKTRIFRARRKMKEHLKGKAV